MRVTRSAVWGRFALDEAVTAIKNPPTGPKPEKLTVRTAAGWAIGSTGTAILLGTVNTLLLKYVVDILLLSALVAGSIITATRFFDAAIDPIMGSISDQTRSRWGRRRPYLLLGSFTCAASLILLFSDPFNVAATYPAIYVTIALCVYAIAYTIFGVPYIAMSYELATTKESRTALMSYRVYAASAGTLVAQAVAPMVVEAFGGGKYGFSIMGYITALAVLLACGVTFLATSESSTTAAVRPANKPRFRDMGKAFGNKPFMMLMGAKGFYLLGTGVANAALAFFLTVALDKSLSILGLLSAFLLGAVILSQSAWVWICNRLGKRMTFFIAVPINVLANLSWLLATPGEPAIGFILRGIAIGIAGGGMTLVIQAMLPDILQHEAERGGGQEGVLSGFFTTIERGVAAISVAVAGAIMSVGGYVAGSEQQDPQAIASLYVCMAVAPGIGMILAAVCLRRYSL
jgi:glycoside/pentoside/hexuronide:cation symporter, GPH family